MSSIRKDLDLKAMCDELNISFEFLKICSENKEYITKQLLTSRSKKTLLEVIDEYYSQIGLWVDEEEMNQRNADNYKVFLRSFKNYILNNDSDILITNMSLSLFRSYLRTCKPIKGTTVTNGTYNTYLNYIRSLMYFAYESNYLFDDNADKKINKKFRRKKNPRLPKYVPDPVVSQVLKASLKSNHPYRNHSIIITLMGTGARVSELVNIKYSDINFEKNYLKLTGKGNKTRTVTLYPLVKQVLLSYANFMKIDVHSTNKIFNSTYANKTTDLRKEAVQAMVSRIFKKLGMDNEYSTHSFRHSFAVNCLKSGMKIELIAELLGHENIETTLIYTKLLNEDLMQEVQKYPLPLEKILFTLFNINEE
ncbi:tyrosine-type recombinase/integrase [Paenibacillus macquariensis]|uniref:Site-specific recombinase XerD n=1 Tax=Paenibacillus macquariensis TaxID=948756 RepID=A0ABY1KE66_9BACL|nr:tyrosine-type recombinase/integrase [Paenibacillus macquariensis]MEC0093425.1 tyrosine-type recombinase/integrase [Paenibacillus macquariensis]OAB38916.1 hypothetical protein PMSM_01120 [Paenibacillus macquariensis subsp. macquariensis]SIR69868.1 Site-specific recombinase XerD [Paenibacillus macquariensis]